MAILSKIIPAIVKASLYWILFNFFLSQFFVAYHWSDFHPIEIRQITKETVIEKLLDPVIEEEIVVVEVKQTTETLVIYPDDSSLEFSRKARSEIPHLLQNQAHYLNTLKSKVDLLKQISQQQTIFPEPSHKPIEETEALSILLAQPTLRTIESESLLEILKLVQEEIDFAIQSDASSSLLKLLLELNYPRSSISDIPKSCPSPPSGARASDLQSSIEVLRQTLMYMTSGSSIHQSMQQIQFQEIIKLPLPQSTLEKFSIIDAEDETVELSIVTEEEDRRCLLEEDFIDMVELAIQKSPADLQSALTSLVKDLDPETQLILDALLPPPLTEGRLSRRPASPTNLRQVLNSELFIYGSTNLIDSLVDWSSGYNDGLDSVIDSLMQQNGDQSVGRVLVTQLLQVAGNIAVPKAFVDLHNTTNAGMLKPTL
jgi:hypothetical protein